MGATGGPSERGLEPKDEARSKPISRWFALAITLVAPCLVLLAQQVRLPGVDIGGLPGDLPKGGSVVSFSIAALGIMPFLSAAYLVELVALAVPSFRRLRHGGVEGRAKLGRATVILALLLAVFQAYSTAKWIDALSLFERPGLKATLLAIMTLVAGVSLLHLIATAISKRGLASGYGVLLALLPLFAIVDQVKFIVVHGEPVVPLLGLALVLGVTGILTWYALESSLIHDRNRPAEEAQGGAPRIPFPASGTAPLSIGASLLALPATLAAAWPALGTIPMGTVDGMTKAGVQIVFVLAAGAILTFCFNHPRRVAALYSRARGKGSQAKLAAEAYAELWPAMAKSAVFLLALLTLDAVATSKLHLSFSPLEIPFAVALLLDIVEELRARKAMPDLVALWPEHRPYAIAAAREALQQAGIPLHARGERLRRLLQFFGPYVPIELMVPEAHAKEAKKILERVLSEREDAAEKRPEEGESIKVKTRRLGLGLVAGLVLLPVAVLALAAPKAKAKKEHVNSAALEFVAVDDEVDLFTIEKMRDLPRTAEHPWPVRIQKEHVPLGPGKMAMHAYAVLEGEENEPLAQIRANLEAWTKRVEIPEGDRFALGHYMAYDGDIDAPRDVGLRTYLLKGKAVITAADVQDAQAMPDPNDDRRGWIVKLEFTPDGAKRFETYTAEHLKQRFAIMVDGIVMSAPVIQTRIPGGIATITMGNASPDQQKKDAQQLARSLGGE